MTMTKSPVSTCGVKTVFSLPRSRLAALTATLPSTWSLASISHHLRGTSLALAENVFISGKRARKLRGRQGAVNLSVTNLHRQLLLSCANHPRQKHLLAADTAAIQLWGVSVKRRYYNGNFTKSKDCDLAAARRRFSGWVPAGSSRRCIGRAFGRVPLHVHSPVE